MKKSIVIITCLCLCVVMGMLPVSGAFAPIPEMEQYGGKSHGIASVISREEKCKPDNIGQYAEQHNPKGIVQAAGDLGIILKYYLTISLGHELDNPNMSAWIIMYQSVRECGIVNSLRTNNITKEQVRAANNEYAEDCKSNSFPSGFDPGYYDVMSHPPAADWVIDAWYEPDVYKSIETLMNPFCILGYYRGGEAGSWTTSISTAAPIGIDTTRGLRVFDASSIIEHSVEELETWGYTAAYWLDYYSFLKKQFPKYSEMAYASAEEYVTDIFLTEPSTDIYDNANYLRGQQYLKTVNERVEYYGNLVKNPATGDTLPAEAGVWFAAAMLSLAVPASLAVIGKKRRTRSAV